MRSRARARPPGSRGACGGGSDLAGAPSRSCAPVRRLRGLAAPEATDGTLVGGAVKSCWGPLLEATLPSRGVVRSVARQNFPQPARLWLQCNAAGRAPRRSGALPAMAQACFPQQVLARQARARGAQTTSPGRARLVRRQRKCRLARAFGAQVACGCFEQQLRRRARAEQGSGVRKRLAGSLHNVCMTRVSAAVPTQSAHARGWPDAALTPSARAPRPQTTVPRCAQCSRATASRCESWRACQTAATPRRPAPTRQAPLQPPCSTPPRS